ncbi:MAG: 50S ribosomal protein L32 [Parcubacteria group bacterium ADurb.Bin316]|nr:MAG: 50S ribosomal protein L32 [Parcubacteria group bacterium ADurb.Bin316]HOZ56515.1 50S ribosomal protein L32 [bacterium]
MTIPKKRHTSSKVARRRSHHALKKVKLTACKKCGKAIMPHRACSFCGSYDGKEAIKIKTAKAKGKK